MTKKEALNKAAQEVGYGDYDHFLLVVASGTLQNKEVDDIIHRAMDIYAGEQEKKLAEALEKIANPIKYLQNEAEKEGVTLNGYMAVEITENANFYKEIARKALEENSSNED